MQKKKNPHLGRWGLEPLQSKWGTKPAHKVCQGKCCKDPGSKQQPVSTCPVGLGGVWEAPSFPVMGVSPLTHPFLSPAVKCQCWWCPEPPGRRAVLPEPYPAVLIDGLQPLHCYVSDMAPPEQDLAWGENTRKGRVRDITCHVGQHSSTKLTEFHPWLQPWLSAWNLDDSHHSPACVSFQRGPREFWDRGGFWFHPAGNTKGFGPLVVMALPWNGLTLCCDSLPIEGHFGMAMLAVQEASGAPSAPHSAASHCGCSCPSRQTNHTPSSQANTRLLVTEPL